MGKSSFAIGSGLRPVLACIGPLDLGDIQSPPELWHERTVNEFRQYKI